MSYNEIFEAKNPLEERTYEFELGDQLLFGETMSGATVAASVYTGTDPTPMAIIDGAAVIVGTKVRQKIIGGVDGVVYTLICVANTTLSHVYSKSASLAIVNQATAYNAP